MTTSFRILVTTRARRTALHPLWRAKASGSTTNSFLLPPTHCLAAILPVVDDIDPAGQTRRRPGAPRTRKRIRKPQVAELDRGPGAIGRELWRLHPHDRLLAHVANHCPLSPIEINLPQECALRSFNGGRVVRLEQHIVLRIAVDRA